MSQAGKMTDLEVLHKLVTDALTEGVKGKDFKAIQEAIKFLKQNGIEPARDANNSALRALSEAVSQIDLENDPDADEAFLN